MPFADPDAAVKGEPVACDSLGVADIAEEEGVLPHGRQPGPAGDPDFRHAVVDLTEQDATGLVAVLGADGGQRSDRFDALAASHTPVRSS